MPGPTMSGMPVEGVHLAIDTSGSVGSVAVGRGAALLEHGSIEQRGAHASGLIPLIDETLELAGVEPDDVETVVVGEGPGSFTGVRVAAATAKGLGRAWGVPVFAVSSLAGAAMAAVEAGRIRYALFDARAERVYGACFGVGSSTVETIVTPHGGELRDLLAGEVPPGAVFVGEAAEKHRAVVEGAGFEVVVTDSDTPIAVGLLAWVARDRGLAPVADLSAWEPEYVRASSAERLWKT